MTHRRLEPLLIAGSCAISFFAQAAAFNDVRFDDAYVTYRYAQNLAMGRGFVFNPGEHILGTTAPGHALVGALLYLVAGKIAFPAVMAALGCIGWTAEAACVYALLADAIGSAGAGFIALAIAMGATRAYFWVPLETHLVTALVLGAFVLAARERWIACGVVAGLAVVVRADAAVACAVLGALALMGRRADGAARPGSLAPAAAFGLAVSVVAGAWTGVLARVLQDDPAPHVPREDRAREHARLRHPRAAVSGPLARAVVADRRLRDRRLLAHGGPDLGAGNRRRDRDGSPLARSCRSRRVRRADGDQLHRAPS